MANDDEDDVWIPCEICDTSVRWKDFEQHTRECSQPTQIRFNTNNANENVGLPIHDILQLISRLGIQIPEENVEIQYEGDEEGGDEEGDEEEEENPRFGSIGVGVSSTNPDMTQYRIVMFANGGENMPDMNDYEFNSMVSEVIGNVERGVKNIDTVIKSVKVCADDICVICQDTINVEVGVEIKKCKHRFCKPCISAWLEKNTKCPTCMACLDDE